MLCLMDRPPVLTQFPGVTNRYEDFVAVHINQSMYIHGTGNFLGWHRYYIWAFEQVHGIPPPAMELFIRARIGIVADAGCTTRF